VATILTPPAPSPLAGSEFLASFAVSVPTSRPEIPPHVEPDVTKPLAALVHALKTADAMHEIWHVEPMGQSIRAFAIFRRAAADAADAFMRTDFRIDGSEEEIKTTRDAILSASGRFEELISRARYNWPFYDRRCVIKTTSGIMANAPMVMLAFDPVGLSHALFCMLYCLAVFFEDDLKGAYVGDTNNPVLKVRFL
jgi:hypothetical protein